MKTTTFCPISTKKIDEHVARLNGGFTIVLLTIYILTENLFPIAFLLVDFALRSGNYSRFSPLAILSRITARLLQFSPVLINAGPKIFAARIGIVFNLLIILFQLTGFNHLALLFTGLFGTCAILESVFGYCVACQFYPFVYKLTYHSDIQKLKI